MRRMTLTLLMLVAAAGTTPASAQTADPAALAEQIQTMTMEAAAVGDDVALRQAIALAERALTVHPGDALLHHYHGYALYRLAARHGCDEETEPGCVWKLLELAEGALETSIQRGPRAETHALLASVYGLMIGENNALGASLGSRIDAAQADALALDPENPRVWLLKGSATSSPRRRSAAASSPRSRRSSARRARSRPTHPRRPSPAGARPTSTCGWDRPTPRRAT